MSLRTHLRHTMRVYLARHLRLAGGDVKRAARMAGASRQTFYSVMARTEIQRARGGAIEPTAHRIPWLLEFFGVVLDDAWRRRGFWQTYEGRLDVLHFEARKGYMAMVRRLHPDTGGSQADAERLAQVNAAWARLEDAFRKHGWQG